MPVNFTAETKRGQARSKFLLLATQGGLQSTNEFGMVFLPLTMHFYPGIPGAIMSQFQDKVVLITGSGRGIGRMLAYASGN